MSVEITHGSFDRLIESVKSVRNLEELGRVAVKEMKLSLERGISPVRGERRFERYSKSYTTAIQKGWLEFKDKKVRPVNLILSGKMLAAIEFKATYGVLQVGIWNSEMVELANYHQEGTDKMPARRFVPTTEGEQLTVTIDRALINKLKDIITRSIR
jgi:hypothetical protein